MNRAFVAAAAAANQTPFPQTDDYLLPAPCCCFGCVAFPAAAAGGGSGVCCDWVALFTAGTAGCDTFTAGAGCDVLAAGGEGAGAVCHSKHEMRSNQVWSPLAMFSSRGLSSSSPSTHVALWE